MLTALEISRQIQRFLDEKELRYSVSEEGDSISFSFKLDCKLNGCNFRVFCRDGNYSLNCFIQICADEDSRINVSEYITRANYGLRYGCFQMDFSDGEISYRMAVNCEGYTDIPEDVIMSCIMIPTRMFETYGDGLVAVIYGFKTPEEAVIEAEKE